MNLALDDVIKQKRGLKVPVFEQLLQALENRKRKVSVNVCV